MKISAYLSLLRACRRATEDRRTELVFIGAGLDRARLAGLLDQLLLTDTELAAGPRGWADLPDPLQLSPLHAPVPDAQPASEVRLHAE